MGEFFFDGNRRPGRETKQRHDEDDRKELHMSTLKALGLALIIPAGLVLALPAAAQGFGGPRGEMVFAELDANGDGVLTQDEVLAQDRGIAAADVDGDGLASRDELLAHAADRAETRIDRLLEVVDTDGDGAVSQAEMDAHQDARHQERRARMVERVFDRMDADGDGALSAEEFEEASARFRERGGRGGFGLFGFGDRG